MRDVLNADNVFVAIAMARQASTSLILVVEGDDDHFLIKEHVKRGDVILISGHGRPAVLKAAEAAELNAVRGIRFLVDVDYDRFINPITEYPSNVIASKHHDTVMDLILVSVGLLDKVIDSHSRSARRRGIAFDTVAVREEAFDLAASVAPLRILNQREEYGLNLRDFPFANLQSGRPTPEDLAKVAVARSRTTLNPQELATEIAAETSHLGAERNDLVGDHDLFWALTKVLFHYGVPAGSDAMWTALIPGIRCSNLEATDWYQALTAWGVENSRVTFACPCAA